MNKILLSVILGVLLLGCAGPSETPDNATEEVEDNATPAGEEPGTGEAPEEVEEAPEEVPEGPPETPEEEAVDLEGLDYAALQALGVPIECNMKTTVEGTTTMSKVYMKGESEARVEIDIEKQADCDKFVYILTNDKMYMGCELGGQLSGTEMLGGCNWLEFSQQEATMEEDEATYGYAASAPEFEDVPPSEISCVPWLYDPSKFDTPGKVCTIEEFVQGYEFG